MRVWNIVSLRFQEKIKFSHHNNLLSKRKLHMKIFNQEEQKKIRNVIEQLEKFPNDVVKVISNDPSFKKDIWLTSSQSKLGRKINSPKSGTNYNFHKTYDLEGNKYILFSYDMKTRSSKSSIFSRTASDSKKIRPDDLSNANDK